MVNALWSPAALAPGVWLDDTTQAEDIGFGTFSWANAGSIGGEFLQFTPSRHPSVMVGALNGKRILRFDGTEDMLAMTGAGADNLFRNKGAGWTFFVAKRRGVDPSGGTTARMVTYAPTASGAARFATTVGVASPNANKHSVGGRRLDSVGGVNAFGAAVGTDWFIRRDSAAWSAGTLSTYANGTLGATATLPSAGNSDDTAGADSGLEIGGNGNANPADIDLACVLMGSGATMPSEADFKRLEGWAAHRYGLTANLPSDHPYKTTPPYAGPIITVRGAHTTDEFRGPGRVYGDTGVKGNPSDVPIGARTTLLRARDHHPVQRAWSNNATGAFEFKGVRLDEDYLVIAEHPDGSFNPVAADRVRAEPMD